MKKFKEKTYKTSYDRVLKISEDYQQITMPDSRYYKRNGEYYPSITHVLSSYPKGKYFEQWLKQVGFAADYIVKKAGEQGTATHNLIESYLQGEEQSFLNENKHPQYDVEVWKMFLRFVDFWETYNPKLIEEEVHLFSDKYKVAGTCDLVCEINGERWIIDFKTSNHLQPTYDLQCAIYAQCYEECYEKKIDRVGILWLKSTKRKSSKDKMVGKNWEMYESSRTQEENLNIFATVKVLFDLENPNEKPSFTEFKTTAKRKI